MRTTHPKLVATSSVVVPNQTTVWTLHPGDGVVALHGERLATLLGWYEDIVLTAPRRTVLALWRGVSVWRTMHELRSSTTLGEAAMQHMHPDLRAPGVEPRLCEDFADGADNMFRQLGTHSSAADKNARWTLGALEYLGPPVLKHDRVGSAYRKLSCTLVSCQGAQ